MFSRLSAILFISGFAGSAVAQPKVIEIQTYPVPANQLAEFRKQAIENLEIRIAQRDTAREQLKAAEVQLDVAKRKQSVLEKAPNASAQEKTDAQAAIDLAQAQIDVRKAELKLAELRVACETRRLERLYPPGQAPVPATAVTPVSPTSTDAKPQSVREANVPTAKADVEAAATNLQIAEAEAKLAEAKRAEAALKQPQAQPQAAVAPQVITTIPPRCQNNLPARVDFPNAQQKFALAQVDFEVANLQFEFAQVEVTQLQRLGITGEQLDAARARLAEAKRGMHVAEDKVLIEQKKIDPFAR